MSGNRFSIMKAARNSYRFVGREHRYLTRVGLMPLGATIIVSMFIANAYGDEALGPRDLLHLGLMSLPVNILMGWYVFLIIRLLLTGERVEKLPADPVQKETRKRLMQASVISFLLLSLGTTLLRGVLWWLLLENPTADNSGLAFATMLLIGGSVWAIRFTAAPVLLAVGYPLKAYTFRVNGIGISLRLGALSLLSLMPVLLTVKVISEVFLPDNLQSLSTQIEILNALGPISSYVSATLFFSSLCFGLREMLSPPGHAPAGDAS